MVVGSGETVKADIAYAGGDLSLLVTIKEAEGKQLGFTWLTAVTRPVADDGKEGLAFTDRAAVDGNTGDGVGPRPVDDAARSLAERFQCP